MKDSDDRAGGNKGHLKPPAQHSGFHTVQPGFTQKGCMEEMDVFIHFFTVLNSHQLKDSSIPTASPILMKCQFSLSFWKEKQRDKQ